MSTITAGTAIRPFGPLTAWPLFTQALAWPFLCHAEAARMGTRYRTGGNICHHYGQIDKLAFLVWLEMYFC
jgi:hypothetical protein